VQSIGWALVHFIWQGALIAAAAAAVLAILPAARPATRYAIASAALIVMCVAPVVTTLRLSLDTDGPGSGLVTSSSVPVATSARTLGGAVPAAAGTSVVPIPSTQEYREYVERALPTAVFLWFVGVLMLSVRLATGWLGVQRLCAESTGPLPEPLQARVAAFTRRLRIARPVRVLESALVAVPTLVGWLRPVILLPAAAVAAMPVAHLEAIIAHELAHVRRHDYLINALQAVVETLLFYHPAVWWCSRQVRIEREHCCDDLAVAACGDRLGYATALANLEELRRGDFRLALAATDGQLLGRVRRVLAAPPAYDGRSHMWLAGVAIAVVLALAGASITVAGANRDDGTARQANATLVPAPPGKDGVRHALIQLSARFASWRGYLFSPQVFRVAPAPPEPPSPPEPPAAPEPPEPPAAPEPPPPPHAIEPLAGPEPPSPPEPPEPPASPEPPAPPEPAEPPVPPAAPQAPTPPSPPAPPAAPAPPAPPTVAGAQSRNRMSWSSRGEQITLDYQGSITLSDDDRDIVSMSPGSFFRLSVDGSRVPLLGTDREIELRGRADGTIERRYFVNRRDVAYEPEGRQWLGEFLPLLVRRTGFNAEARITRFLRRDGAAGVAREIGLLESDFVRSLYVRLLAKQATLSTADLTAVLQPLEISSDFEMAQALVAIVQTQTIGGSAGPAYFRAARTIDSDFELRRALSPLLSRPHEAAFTQEMFAVSVNIGSDFEQAEFLKAAAVGGQMERAPDAFFDALSNVGSDFEHRRVLKEVVRRTKDVATVTLLFRDAARISSDFEQAEFLREAAKAGLVESGRDAFFGAAATIGSDFEQRRALTAVVEQSGVPVETLTAVVRSASDIGSDFEQAELLLTIARRHKLDGSLRQAVLDLADSMGSDFERGRVVAAVVRSERAGR
jgi:beta-lactamase regulating signal transducer with metallopeptidase domain